jgi:hypothetical protein
MCQDSCTTFQQSLQTAFVTERYCNQLSPLPVLQARQEVINEITKTCRLDQPATKCVATTRDEQSNCGYGDSEPGVLSAQKWCQLRPFELCCRDPALQARNQQNNQQNTNGTNTSTSVSTPSNGQQLDPAVIPLAIVAGILFLIGVGLLTRYFLQKRKLSTHSVLPKARMMEDAKFTSTTESKTPLSTDVELPPAPVQVRRRSVMDARQSVYTVIVTHKYAAEKDDELNLLEGDRLLVTAVYADGWCLGTNSDTGKTGIFPAVCVANL